MMYRRDTPFALPDTHDGHVVYDPVDVVQADRMAVMCRNPCTAWMDIPPNLNVAEFAMPEMWDAAEYHAQTAQYRAL